MDQTPWYVFTLLNLDSILITARPYHRTKINLPPNLMGLSHTYLSTTHSPDAISPSWLRVVRWWTSWCLSEWVGELDGIWNYFELSDLSRSMYISQYGSTDVPRQ